MKKTSARGFTLIETTIAILIVGVIAVLFSSAVNTYSLTRDSRNEDVALRIASGKIAALRDAGYNNLPGSGPFSDALLNSLPSGTASTSISTFNAKTKRVDVIVGWKRGTVSRSYTLTTLITEIGGL